MTGGKGPSEGPRGLPGGDQVLDPELLALLVCPSCRSALDWRSSELLLVCTACGLRYPVRDGIPILLVDQAVAPDSSGEEELKPLPDGT